jgi:hypothetical protein
MTVFEIVFITLVLALAVLLIGTALRKAADRTPGEDVGLDILDQDTEASNT